MDTWSTKEIIETLRELAKIHEVRMNRAYAVENTEIHARETIRWESLHQAADILEKDLRKTVGGEIENG